MSKKVRKLTLPPPIPVPPRDNPEDTGRLLAGIIVEANDRSSPLIDHIESKLDARTLKKLHEEAEKIGEDTTVFLRTYLNRMSAAYIGLRTGIVRYHDRDDDQDITSGIISNTLTELSDLIGKKLTEQIYRTLTANLDTVLETRYGRAK